MIIIVNTVSKAAVESFATLTLTYIYAVVAIFTKEIITVLAIPPFIRQAVRAVSISTVFTTNFI